MEDIKRLCDAGNPLVCVLLGCRPFAPAVPTRNRPCPQQRLQRCAAISINAEEAKRLIEREGYKILDVRSARDYDQRHITKPSRCSLNAPVVENDGSPNQRFLEEVRYTCQI